VDLAAAPIEPVRFDVDDTVTMPQVLLLDRPYS
jgi:hypothetical protein